MRNHHLVAVLVLAVIVGASVLALRAGPAIGQEEEGEADSYLGTRYRVEVRRYDWGPATALPPTTLQDLEGNLPGAIVPLDPRAAADGHFGAIPYRSGTTWLKDKGVPNVLLFRGEAEGTVGNRCSIIHGQKFPVKTIQLRGNQTTVTTAFEKVGVTVSLTPMPHRPSRRPAVVHQAKLELSGISAFTTDNTPVISTFSSQGEIVLPDGYEAVFSFVDRIPGPVIGEKQMVRDEKGRGVPADHVVQYVLKICRLDLTSR